jgi:mannosyltransferase
LRTPDADAIARPGAPALAARLRPLLRPLLGPALVAILAAAVVLRFWARVDLWLDEALSVNIARLPLDQIPDALRHDGHPPLYYFLLHGWMRVFGSGDVAVRALSGVLAVATLPVAWFAGRRVGGRPVAWLTVVVLAASPFALRYATEARMYSLVILCVFAGHGAVHRALERPTPARLAPVAVLTAVLVLTMYWALFLLAAVGAALAWTAWRASTADERRAARRTLGAMVVGGLAFVPWLPVFADQLAHTGTPWGEIVAPWVSLARTLMAYAGAVNPGGSFLLITLLVALPVVGLLGRTVDRHRIELDLRAPTPVRWEAAVVVGALGLGVGVSFLTGTTFEPRYATIVFPLVVLLMARGLSVLPAGGFRLAALGAVVALGFAGGYRVATTERTQAGEVAAVLRAEAVPGDVVVYCPDQLGPALDRLLADRPGLVQLTFPDGAPPQRIDWRDYEERATAVDPARFAARALERAGDHAVWYVTVARAPLEQPCADVGTALANARPAVTRVAANEDEIFDAHNLVLYRD